MISSDLWGGIGNQMFMMAAAIGHAKRMNTDFMFSAHTLDNRIWPRAFPSIIPTTKLGLLHLKEWKSPTFEYSPIPMENNIRIHGFFQSEKYFSDYRDEIIDAFKLRIAKTEDGEIPSVDAVSIHVRRGDYLQYPDKHPVCTLGYFNQAMENFPDDEFIVFSDDLQWCHKYFKGERFKFAHGGNPYMDMAAMMTCKSNIISNSTFSWWAAWLNQCPTKIIVSPDESNWFGPGNAHLPTHDIIPESWIRIKFKNLEIEN